MGLCTDIRKLILVLCHVYLCIVDITGEIAGYTMYMYMYIIRTCNVSDTLLSAV